MQIYTHETGRHWWWVWILAQFVIIRRIREHLWTFRAEKN